MTEQPALWGMPEDTAPAPREKVSPQRRATQLALERLTAGIHPITKRALHPDAPPINDRTAPGPRCGTCTHLYRKVRSKEWLKCEYRPAASLTADVRRWYPACTLYDPQEGGDT